MVNTYIAIKDNKIEMILQTSDGIEAARMSAPSDCELQEVINDFEGITGEDVRSFDASWNRRPLQDLVTDNLLQLDPKMKIENNEITLKTVKELIDEGLVQLQPHEKYDEVSQEVVFKTWQERVDDQSTTYEDWLTAIVRPYRDQLLNDCDIICCNPERWWSYTDEQKTAWSVYKQVLRDITTTNLTIVDTPEEISWPQLPQ